MKDGIYRLAFYFSRFSVDERISDIIQTNHDIDLRENISNFRYFNDNRRKESLSNKTFLKIQNTSIFL